MKKKNNPKAVVPEHVALIMDGNGRWARKRNLPKIAGHKQGIEAVKRIMEAAIEHGVRVLTFYTFSTENWSRPRSEVNNLLKLLNQHITKDIDGLSEKDIRLNIIGRVDDLPDELRKKLLDSVEKTSGNKTLLVNMAISYGSRDEIIRAARKAASDAKKGIIDPEKIDEAAFSGYLDTAGQPDPDLVIRTSGEQRVSNFLLWQISYSELLFTDKFWPDFGKDDFARAITVYGKRRRKFGG
jgi:undecaprenyl diphosphate synthase